MKKLSLMLFLSLSIFFFYSCAASPHAKWVEEYGYDNSDTNISDQTIQDMLSVTFKVDTSAIYLDEAGKERLANASGTAFYIGNGKFVTCDHVIEWPEKLNVGWGIYYTLLQINPTYVIINDIEIEVSIIISNQDHDVAVIQVDNEFIPDVQPIEFADDEINYGDICYAVGYPGVMYAEGEEIPEDIGGRFLSRGIVVNLAKHLEFYIISADLNPGNSGGPVFVFKDGKPYIAGQSRLAWRQNRIYGATKSTIIEQVIGEAD